MADLREILHQKAEESRIKRVNEVLDELLENCIKQYIDDVPFPSQVLKMEIEKIKEELSDSLEN